MKTTVLEFEQPIAELETRIEELRFVQDDSAVDISDEIQRLTKRSQTLTKDIYGKLTPWQVAQVARHPQRPYTLDYIGDLFTEFTELHGDRSFADDLSIVGGLARFNGTACVVLGHQKGRDTKEKIARNFGMPKPEGYRKALRIMQLAEKFGRPIFTLIDTPGAYPGIGAEERGQAEAIARNLIEMAQLRVPVIVTITGEGGSGGALALGIGDRVLILEYAIYSVISPEGCAAILWKDQDRKADAAEAMRMTAPDLKALGIVSLLTLSVVGIPFALDMSSGLDVAKYPGMYLLGANDEAALWNARMLPFLYLFSLLVAAYGASVVGTMLITTLLGALVAASRAAVLTA